MFDTVSRAPRLCAVRSTDEEHVCRMIQERLTWCAARDARTPPPARSPPPRPQPEFMALFQHINPLVPRDRLMRMFDAGAVAACATRLACTTPPHRACVRGGRSGFGPIGLHCVPRVLGRLAHAAAHDARGTVAQPAARVSHPQAPLRHRRRCVHAAQPAAARSLRNRAADGRSSRPKLTPQLAWEVFDRDASQEIEFQVCARADVPPMRRRR